MKVFGRENLCGKDYFFEGMSKLFEEKQTKFTKIDVFYGCKKLHMFLQKLHIYEHKILRKIRRIFFARKQKLAVIRLIF